MSPSAIRRRARLPLLAACWLLAVATAAQLPKPEEVVKVRLEPASAAPRQGRVTTTFVADILEGFHINSSKPTQDYLVASKVELAADTPAPAAAKPEKPAAPAITLERADFPAGALKSFGFAPDDKLSVYDGTVKIPLRLRVPSGLAPGEHAVRLVFHYQACNDQVCLRPARREATLTVRLPASGNSPAQPKK